MSAHARDGVTAAIPVHANAALDLAFEPFMFDPHPLTRREIAHFIATDGLTFLAMKNAGVMPTPMPFCFSSVIWNNG
jgi:hypothetical protein